MGPGFNRMNAITVQQTTQGLLKYMEDEFWGPAIKQLGVVIGYDGRHHSREFAHIAAAVFVSRGVPVRLFSKVVPTPFVSTGVRLLGCAAGIMITASHNPKEDNGYKVYWANGCQIIPPLDAGIAAAIDSNLELWELEPAVLEGPYSSPLVADPLDEVSSRYLANLSTALRCRTAAANVIAPLVAYTAMHGVGTPWVLQAFSSFGLPRPILVTEQCDPDPEFPTVPFPNPEEGKGAWDLAFKTAQQYGVQLAFATDPDADRFAAAEQDPTTGRWRAFTGNEIGAMLAHWVLTNYLQQEGALPVERLAMLSSTVSSRMLEGMARQEGFHWQETLTGFKWLGNEALQLEREGYTVLFAFEEAIGFMFGQVGKDKDGVAASVVFAELTADVYTRGLTLAQHWQQLQQQYGAYEYRSGYIVAQPPSLSHAVFERLRSGYPQQIGGQRVTAVRDLGTGLDTSQEDRQAVLPWQPGDLMITFTLQGPATLTLRASGTEPKLKFYLEVAGGKEGGAAAAELAEKLERAVAEELPDRPQAEVGGVFIRTMGPQQQ
ncbi:hypothetical protein N2152v2_003876 [Parachlorella kessleri]